MLAGQTWSTLTDVDLVPPTLDFETPTTFIIRRAPMVRYTHPLGEGLVLRVAAEYPNFVLDAGAAGSVSGEFEIRAPDGVVRVNLDRGPVSLAVSGVARYLRFREESGVLTEKLGIGGVLMLKVKAHPRLTLWAEAMGGQGVGGYRGFADLAVNRQDELVAVPLAGGLAGVTFNWLENLRSTGVFSAGMSPVQASTANEETQSLIYAALNLQWFPVERVMVGLEGLYGQRNGAYAGGLSTSAHDFRLQGSMRVSLP